MATSARSQSHSRTPPSSRRYVDEQRAVGSSRLHKSESAPNIHTSVPPNIHSARDTSHYIPYIGNFPVTGIPGYGGYIPGKTSENVIGTTFQRSNELAYQACDMRATQPYEMPIQAYNPEGVTAHRRGFDMVGYKGFVPGKYAQNVFGHVFTRSNAISSILKTQQFDEKKRWIEKLRSQGPPLPNGTGVVGYVGYNGALNRTNDLHWQNNRYESVNAKVDKSSFVRPGFTNALQQNQTWA